jgi:hypothetical protein
MRGGRVFVGAATLSNSMPVARSPDNPDDEVGIGAARMVTGFA